MRLRPGSSFLRSSARGGPSWIVLAAALLAAGPAAAQARPGSVEFGGGAGRFLGGTFARGSTEVYDRTVLADQDILRGFWFGTQLTREWGVEVSVRRTVTHLVADAGGVFPNRPALADFIPGTVEISGARSFPLGSFVPYVGFGAGMMNVEIDTEDVAVRDVNRFSTSMMVGARLYAARWIGWRFDVRARATYLGARRLGEDQGSWDAKRWFVNGEIFGGFFVTLGGKP